jgi:hypothetical protein
MLPQQVCPRYPRLGNLAAAQLAPQSLVHLNLFAIQAFLTFSSLLPLRLHTSWEITLNSIRCQCKPA